MPNYAKDAAVVKYPWTSTKTTPTFTGLPPHVVILATCEELKFELAKAKGEIIQDIKDDLDSRPIGSQSHYDKEEIIRKIGALHDALLEKIARVGSGYASYASQSDDYGEDADMVLQQVSDNNDVTCATNTHYHHGRARWRVMFSILLQKGWNCVSPSRRICVPENDICNFAYKLVLWKSE